MKKNCLMNRRARGKLFKLFLIMKMSCFFLLVFCLQLSARVSAQYNALNVKANNANVREVIEQIKRQCNLTFVYNVEELDHIGKVSVDVKQESVDKILELCLKDSGFTYTLVDGVVVIKRMQKVQPVEVTKITGIVKDQDGTSLPGVSVMIKGTSLGVTTDVDGKFALSVPGVKNVILVFTFVGMKPQEVVYKGQKEVKVVMSPLITELEEAVVPGVFRKAKESFTGAVTIVTAEELRQFGTRNLITSLRNIDPSFNIVENNAFGSNPNKLPEVQIRGNSSLPNVDELKDETRVNMNTPLVILDGFESSLQKLLDMNENEVETIAILKDASATSVYGSRGANGVVVITTKSPTMGKLRVSYRGNLNIEVPDLSAYDILNAREKLDLEKKVGLWDKQDLSVQQNYNDLLNDINSGVNTYWMSKPLRTGVGHRHNLRLEGGDKTFRYSASVQYNDVQGVMKESFRKNLNGTINLSYYYNNVKFINSLTIGIGNTSESPYGAFSAYVRMNPYYKTHDEAGNVIKTYTRYEGGYVRINTNPLYNPLLNTYETSESTDLTNNFSLEWKVIPEILIRARLGVTKKSNQKDDFKPAEHTDFAEYVEADLFRRGSYKYGTGKGLSYDGSLNISYSKTFAEKHTIYAGFDYSIRQSKNSNYNFEAEGFNNEEFDFISMALQYAKDNKPSGSESFSRSLGFTGSINYMYDNRYYLDLSGRTDGSSQFGSSKRFAPFWSMGAGWNIHREAFLKDNAIISFLKLRVSTGITGSQSFSSYQAMSTYKYFTDKRYYQWLGATMAGLGNEDLRWQQKMNYNFGLEVKLFNNRLSFSGDYYTTTTKDMISTVNIPAANGFTSYIENAGEMQNKGFELKASVFIIRDMEQDISWSVTGALMHNENEIVSVSKALLDAQKDLEKVKGSNPNLLYRPGYSTNTIWVVPSLGIDPSTGREIYVDRNGDFTYAWDARDLTACGVGEPKYQGNFSTMLRYKDLSVNLSFGYRWGGQLYNSTLIDKVENANFRENVDARVYYDRWENPGDVAAFKGLKVTDKTYKTSRFVEDESTLTCQSMDIQYEFKSASLNKYLGLETLQIQGSTSDLFHISTVKRERGTSYPFSRQFSLSLNAVF